MAVDDAVREAIQSGKGFVVIVAGSGSDKPHIDKLVNLLDHYGINYDVRIGSGHKQPGKVKEMINEYDALGGCLAYITVAGGEDALSGIVSCNTTYPVISSPPDATPTNHNMSCLGNPKGSSNAYLARPENAVKFIAQMFSYADKNIKGILELDMAEKIAELEKDDAKVKGPNFQMGPIMRGN